MKKEFRRRCDIFFFFFSLTTFGFFFLIFTFGLLIGFDSIQFFFSHAYKIYKVVANFFVFFLLFFFAFFCFVWKWDFVFVYVDKVFVWISECECEWNENNTKLLYTNILLTILTTNILISSNIYHYFFWLNSK